MPVSKVFSRALSSLIASHAGRLTLQSGVPVMVTTQSAKTRLYWAPYQGNFGPIYNGSEMVLLPSGEIYADTTDVTKSPAVIGANKVNDWYRWNDNGVITLSHGPDWTNDTTRSAAGAHVDVNGITLNAVAITPGPGASRGTWVGTTRSNASSQLQWILGSTAAGGGMASLHVWNAYNRVQINTLVGDTSSYTYGTNLWRPSNNSATNRVNWVTGGNEEGMLATHFASLRPAALTTAWAEVGLNLDATNASGINGRILNPTASTFDGSASPTLSISPTNLGAHFVSAVESGDGATSTTFFGWPKQGLTFQFYA